MTERYMGTLPEGRRLNASAPAERMGSMGTQAKGAFAERLAWSRKHFIEASAHDFRVLLRESRLGGLVEGRAPQLVGRLWEDKATGEQYKVVKADPMMQADASLLGVSCFIVVDERVVYLRRREEKPRVSTVRVGHPSAFEVTPATAQGERVRIW
jgi:hypothetical protein